MMITRVYGSCNEFAIEFQRREGSDLEIWDAIVPANRDGQYVIEIYAESSGGLTAYTATVLFLISGHEIAGKLVPRGYTAESENIEYNIAGASISPTSVQTGAKYAIAVDVRNVQYVLGTSDGSALATSDGSMLRVKE